MIKESNKLFPMSFNNDFRAIQRHDFTEYIEAGGRGSTKSSFISLNVILLILQNPDFNALVLRKVSNTLRDSVYTQLKWACEQLGVLDRFNFTLTPLQATYTRTGQTIFFRGADDPLKIKSIKPLKGYIAITWFEEWAEFTPADTETIKLSAMRGGNSFYMFYSFNPPSSARNWVNNEVRIPKEKRFIHNSSYLTVPPEWLGEAFLFEAEEMKRRNERAYRNIFLGEPTGTGSNIFENVELRKITDDEIKKMDWLYNGVDFGYYPDPFIYNEFSYNAETKTLYIIDELKLLKHRNEEASNKLKEHLQKKWTARGNSYYDFQNDRLICDSAEPKSVSDFVAYGWNAYGCHKFPHSLEAGMKWLQGLNRIVIDPERAPEAADEFSLYEYALDKKTGEILEGFPDGQPDHAIAAARYALEDVWQRKGM